MEGERRIGVGDVVVYAERLWLVRALRYSRSVEEGSLVLEPVCALGQVEAPYGECRRTAQRLVEPTEGEEYWPWAVKGRRCGRV